MFKSQSDMKRECKKSEMNTQVLDKSKTEITPPHKGKLYYSINKNTFPLKSSPRTSKTVKLSINSLGITKHFMNSCAPINQLLCGEMSVLACCRHLQNLCFLFLQVRSSLFELAKKTKFNLCRHIVVTCILLVVINLLVIFIPSMKDIFGVVGMASWLCASHSTVAVWRENFTIAMLNFLFFLIL